jgi:hypothetical protein
MPARSSLHRAAHADWPWPRKCEAAKVTPRTVHGRRETDRREAWRRHEILQRKIKYTLAIQDHPPSGWADDLYSDDYVAPDGWPPNRTSGRF